MNQINRTLVLGIGSRLMGDDGIGVCIAEALGQEYGAVAPAPPWGSAEQNRGTVKFAAGETDVDYCLSELDDCDICVIIDASYSGKEPCSVEVTDLAGVFEELRPVLAFHEFDLLQAMKREGRLKEGILITVEVCSVGFSAELSPLMRERFEDILSEIKKIITDRIFLWTYRRPVRILPETASCNPSA